MWLLEGGAENEFDNDIKRIEIIPQSTTCLPLCFNQAVIKKTFQIFQFFDTVYKFYLRFDWCSLESLLLFSSSYLGPLTVSVLSFSVSFICVTEMGYSEPEGRAAKKCGCLSDTHWKRQVCNLPLAAPQHIHHSCITCWLYGISEFLYDLFSTYLQEDLCERKWNHLSFGKVTEAQEWI